MSDDEFETGFREVGVPLAYLNQDLRVDINGRDKFKKVIFGCDHSLHWFSNEKFVCQKIFFPQLKCLSDRSQKKENQ